MKESSLEEILGSSIAARVPLGGGSINDVCRIETASGERFVLKSGSGGSVFAAEADGLETLRAAKAIRVPRVFGNGMDFLLLEWIEKSRPRPGFFREFGRSLALLHRTTGETVGYSMDNFIGALPQSNAPSEQLAEFFARRRFMALANLGVERGRLRSDLRSKIARLCERLPDLLAPIDEPPALLHGDLWSGNFLVADAAAVLIDPAVYYGPREADLAMTRLFGGFPEEFYSAYEEDHPLPDGWRDRVDLFNLYHLLTHAIMFGGGYGAQAEATVERYLR